MSQDALAQLKLYLRAEAACEYAEQRDAPGVEFNRFGRRLGRQLLLNGSAAGLQYLLSPVNIVRYFEFPFALSGLPASPRRCLDVGSPALFSLYVADREPGAEILMLNPDARDAARTAEIASAIGVANLKVEARTLQSLKGRPPRFDCIWSISVVEHIDGDFDDRAAVRLMYSLVAPGGRLVLTVPVDRRFTIYYRDQDYYGTQRRRPDGSYFFYRCYDRAAVWERLVGAVGREPVSGGWFGETTPGRFLEYEQRWMKQGYELIVDDPREIADHYRSYPSWDAMPGYGICGLVFEKPRG